MVETAALADRPVAESVPPEPLMRRSSLATAVFVILLFVAAVVLMYAGRHLTFFADEWTFVLVRRGSSVGTFLDPHNGHLVVFAVLVYKLLFALVGLHHYWPYRLVDVVLHLATCALLYVLVRRRLGPWLALGPAVLLLFMGSAWQLLLWPFQITFLASTTGGLLALVLLDQGERRRDRWVAAALVFSLSGSDLGLAFLVAAAVRLALGRAHWRRYWVVAVPLLLWLIWYAGWGTSQHITSNSILPAPEYVADAAAGAVAGIAGLSVTWGPPLALGLLALVIVSWRRRLGDVAAPLLLAAAAGALVFWGLAAIVRSNPSDPTASRYLYVGAVFILLIAADARIGLGLRGGWLAAGAVLVVAAIVGNIGILREGEGSLRASDNSVRTSLGAVEIASRTVSPAFIIDRLNAPQLTAGPILAAIRQLGSPAYTVAQLESAPGSLRIEADQVLEHAEELGATPASAAELTGTCVNVAPAAGLTPLPVAVAPGRLLVIDAGRGSGAALFLRRFAPSYALPSITNVHAGRTFAVRFPADEAPAVPWHVAVRSSSALRVCVS